MIMVYCMLITDPINDAGRELLQAAGNTEVSPRQRLTYMCLSQEV
jgi:hypothetical protein